MLSHQKLKVYGKGLAVVASLAKHSAAWDKRHSVIDQLCRASESIVLNLAEATRLDSPPQKQQLLDYAVGSAVKAAAYLDLSGSKAELDAEQRLPGLELLGRVVLMLRALSGSQSE